MRHIFLLLISPLFFSCNNVVPEEKEITTELYYYPEQQADITNKKYRRWTIALKSVYEKIEADSGKISNIGHLNIATAFMELQGPKQTVLDQFYLAQQKNLESTAEGFPMIYSSFEKVDGYLTQLEYDSMINKFKVIMANKVEEEVIDPETYAKEGGYDVELVKLMASLLEKDQEFRMSDIGKQQLVDQKNISIIDSLFQVYESYIGKTLVGEKYQGVMKIVIQHADLGDQVKYLPIVHQAVKDSELSSSFLKLLIDRVYNRKYGYQIFGSQAGVDLADDETIRQVKNEFGL